MAEVSVIVAGRSYRLGCEAGQEAHLAALASTIDAEARAIAARTGALAEGTLLLMTALMIADRLHDTAPALEAASAQPGAMSATELRPILERLEAMLQAEEAGAS